MPFINNQLRMQKTASFPMFFSQHWQTAFFHGQKTNTQRPKKDQHEIVCAAPACLASRVDKVPSTEKQDVPENRIVTALCNILSAVLRCRLSAGDSSLPEDSVACGQFLMHANFPLGGRGSCQAEVNCQVSVAVVHRQPQPRHSCPVALGPHQPATHRTFARRSAIPQAVNRSAIRGSTSSSNWYSVVVAWAAARVVYRVQAPPPRGELFAQADGYCRLRLSGCVFLARKQSPVRIRSMLHAGVRKTSSYCAHHFPLR
jgi:hypothetical protein